LLAGTGWSTRGQQIADYTRRNAGTFLSHHVHLRFYNGFDFNPELLYSFFKRRGGQCSH
jgi:hypothetical protein